MDFEDASRIHSCPEPSGQECFLRLKVASVDYGEEYALP